MRTFPVWQQDAVYQHLCTGFYECTLPLAHFPVIFYHSQSLIAALLNDSRSRVWQIRAKRNFRVEPDDSAHKDRVSVRFLGQPTPDLELRMWTQGREQWRWFVSSVARVTIWQDYDRYPARLLCAVCWKYPENIKLDWEELHPVICEFVLLRKSES